MKKKFKNVISLLLIAVMVITTTTVSFAANDVGEATTKAAVVKLDIAKSEKDMAIIKSYQKKKDSPLSKEKNNIEVVFTKIKEDGTSVVVSGTVKAKMYGNLYESSFENKELEIKYLKNKKFYAGCIETKIDNQFSALIDITTMYNFSKSVITYTLVDELKEEQQVMFYGDTFKEQIELMKQEVALEQKKQNSEALSQENNLQAFAETKGTNPYEFVKNTYSERLDGVSTGKQMIVMSVSKCDPKNIGSGVIGYEKIRVFSRNYNVLSQQPNAVTSQPYRMRVEFTADQRIMGINHLKPSKENSALENVFKVFLSVVGAVGNSQVAAVSTLIGSLNLNLGDTTSKSGTKAVFDVNVSDKAVTSINLPKSGSTDPSEGKSGSAHLNTKNGIPFTVSYEGLPGKLASDVTVTSVITYRLILNTDRYLSLKSGTATVNHTINQNKIG